MAAMWKQINALHGIFRFPNKFGLFAISKACKSFDTPAIYKAKVDDIANNEEPVVYPPITPRFPPGQWSPLTGKLAWQFYNEAQELQKVQNIKERLEKMAGEEGVYMVRCGANDQVPDTMQYKQYVTKTHLMDEELTSVHGELDVQSHLNNLKTKIEDAILCHYDQSYVNLQKPRDNMHINHDVLGNVIYTLLSNLSLNNDHLLFSQLDENVRIETFWKRGGYTKKPQHEAEDISKNNLGIRGISYGMISLQYREKADWQIRTELPLPEFVDRESEISKGACEEYTYVPASLGQQGTKFRPTNISGHWIEDPCEWGQVSFYTCKDQYGRFESDIGPKHMQNHLKQMAMTSGFGSCTAQAYNQGFSYLNELTYPITTHTVVCGRNGELYICAYQLNTLNLFKDDTANPYRNLAWVTGPHTLYHAVEDGKIIGFNDNTLELLLKCLLLKPVDRGVDLRPYLQNEDSPLNKVHINDIGQPLINKPKHERFQYPRNAVYF